MEQALILGTGGASKAVVFALKKIGIKCLCVSRLPNEQQLNYDQLNDLVLKHHLLIVNTTPLGTSPNINECPNIPYQYITEKHLLVDLVYNPEETLFLKKEEKFSQYSKWKIDAYSSGRRSMEDLEFLTILQTQIILNNF